MTDPVVTRHFRLDGVITTVDAVAGQGTLDRHIEAVKQAALADRIVLTKTDIADADDCLAMEGRLRAINRVAPIMRASKGEIDPVVLFDIGFYDAATKNVDAQRWLDDEMQFRHAHDSEHHHHHDVNRHDDRIRAVCLAVEQPIAGEAFDRWLSDLLRLRGPDLLRFKAIVNVAGLAGPLVVQGVQHVIYPPVTLKTWPSADRRSRLVFTTHDIDERVLRDSLGMLTNEVALAAG
jgi:G3E family GTPase